MTIRAHTDFCVIHCTASPPSADIGVREIRDYHVHQKGWSDIGYHYVIRRSGAIELGRQEDTQGAHVLGHNRYSIAIALVGGIDENKKAKNNFTIQQWVALGRLTEHVKRRWPFVQFKGHRDFSPDQNNDGVISQWEWIKQCPSFDVASMINTEDIGGVYYGPGIRRTT